MKELNEIQAKWLVALRSGKYKQGRASLRNINDEFCCLGVLCDVLDNTKWMNKSPDDDVKRSSKFIKSYMYEGNSGSITNEIGIKAGIVIGEDRAIINALIAKNDIIKVSFGEIACFLEGLWNQ